jgi:hypothetical protein
MVQEMATLWYRYGAKTLWILEMISDAILEREVQKLILLMNIIFGADQQSQMLLADQCHSLFLQTDNKTLCKSSIIGTIMT